MVGWWGVDMCTGGEQGEGGGLVVEMCCGHCGNCHTWG